MRVPESGLKAVGVVKSLTLKDSRRSCAMQLKVYYPRKQELCPVIIFSHGKGGSKNSFSHLGRFWASQGYVCIHPTHADLSLGQERERQGVSLAARREHRVLTRLAAVTGTQICSAGQERVQDLRFLVAALDELEQAVPDLRGKLDRSRIGAAGHSLGAYTVLLIAGAVVGKAQGGGTSDQDARIRVFLAISPQGTGEGGLDENSWQHIEATVMTVGGTRERGDSWRMEPFKYMPPGDKYHVLIHGAAHSSYNDHKPDRVKYGQDQEVVSQVHADLQRVSTVFWDAYLKRQRSAQDQLKFHGFERQGHAQISIFRK